MVSKVLIAFMALVVVAAAFELAEEGDDLEAEMDFIKRDPVMQDFFLAEKRGRSMKKFKSCGSANAQQKCFCYRRGGAFAFCSGQGDGSGM